MCGGSAKARSGVFSAVLVIGAILLFAVIAFGLFAVASSILASRDSTGSQSPPVRAVESSSSAITIPTEERTWRSAEGREIVGRITAIDPAARTVTIERTDGQAFPDYSIDNLDPEDAALLAPLLENNENP